MCLPLCAGPSWASGMQREYIVSWTSSISPRIYLLPSGLGWAQPMRDTSWRLQGRRRVRLGVTCPPLGRSLLWSHLSRKGTQTAFSTHLTPDSRNCSPPFTSPVLEPSPPAGPALSLLNFLCKQALIQPNFNMLIIICLLLLLLITLIIPKSQVCSASYIFPNSHSN